MSRPKGKKGRTRPMSELSGYAGPDFEVGQVVHECSMNINHADYCDGTCPDKTLGQLECDLVNEMKAWQRVGMPLVGIPDCLIDKLPLMGMNVDLLDVSFKIDLLAQLVIGKGIVTEDELNEMFMTMKLERLKKAREGFEMVQKIQAIRAPIFGPDGNSKLN